MNLLPDDKQNYLNLKKGYEGEVMFDSWTENLGCDCCILNDLRLKFNNSVFQIDTLIIFQQIIQAFEVKILKVIFFTKRINCTQKTNLKLRIPYFS
jgi:hypothetical protein